MTDLALPPVRPADDVQAARPQARLSLSRVGVTGVERVVRLGPPGAEEPYPVVIDCSVDLGPDQRGAHMSRFDEAIEEAIGEAALRGSVRADTLAGDIAERVRERQGRRWAEVSLAARFPRLRRAPVSGAVSQSIHTLLGAAAAREGRTRRVAGVSAQGITACPCGQAMATDEARERLAADGFDSDEIERVLACVPVATHNQRGVGTLWVGAPEGEEPASVDPHLLLGIVEESMSSEIYELLKRPDEAHVVAKAHRRPRFVEDCVREMVRMSVERLGHLGEHAFVSARQENLETIHQHSVAAERHGLLGELAGELSGGSSPVAGPTRAQWLDGD
ncbi:MAG: GTP cyclohydrolase I FolE2 [Thermoleophilaceae bacterium]|jgi:GTP cyclohydrolase I/GTP cyclohydrolase-4|nr:GTP cyclohydrolase I FolE2 [Thermoleophilaceae bacterium]MDQ3241281.1 GTP cyclohydrolase MptA [Actinomycetota bacterium]MDQ3320299.1 GTP cyclohydrolase MptA [Actinomycetota bacterium]MDQ3356644.1 GTP cyclohydrolase MptA [Actinomycetota bacterium]